MTLFWRRNDVIDGAFVLDIDDVNSVENIDEYFGNTSYCDQNHRATMQSYKVHVCRDGDKFILMEVFATAGKVSNELILGVEAPFRYPDEQEGLKLFFSGSLFGYNPCPQ